VPPVGRFRGFDREMQQAIGVDVLWDDREFFYIEHLRPDTVERIQRFLIEYRGRKEPAT